MSRMPLIVAFQIINNHYVILSLARDIYNSLQDIHCNSFVAGIIILEISM